MIVYYMSCMYCTPVLMEMCVYISSGYTPLCVHHTSHTYIHTCSSTYMYILHTYNSTDNI